MKEKPQMPLALAKKQAASEIKITINSICKEYEIPFFELEDIIFRIACEVREGAERELKEAEISYRKAMDLYNDGQDKNGDGKQQKLDTPSIKVL